MLYLDVACNDPDNGIFAGRATMLQIGIAEFSASNFGAGYAFNEINGAIRLAGKKFPVQSSKNCVGNWCWNRYMLGTEKGMQTPRWWLTDFVIWLRGRGIFQCDAGTVGFCHWFDGDHYLVPAKVHTLVCELEE